MKYDFKSVESNENVHLYFVHLLFSNFIFSDIILTIFYKIVSVCDSLDL